MRPLTPSLLLVAVALLVRNTFRKSPTVNEQSHLLVATAISALPHVTIIPDLQLPAAEPAWTRGEQVLAGDAFFWRPNPNRQRLMGIRRESPTSAIAYQACWPASI